MKAGTRNAGWTISRTATIQEPSRPSSMRLRPTGGDGAGDGKTFTKTCNVYLPYGYSASGNKPFDILYLQHGAGGDESSWLGEPHTSGSDAKRILGHLMTDGRPSP